jgi:alpha-beta hydrolase superfamily lysophospholipase
VQCFDNMYHEILNDPERDQVLTVIEHWLERLQSLLPEPV